MQDVLVDCDESATTDCFPSLAVNVEQGICCFLPASRGLWRQGKTQQ